MVSHSLAQAVQLWKESKEVDSVNLLDRWAKELEKQDQMEMASAIYSFVHVHLDYDAGRAMDRMREQKVLPDTELLSELFRVFFPKSRAPVYPLEESAEFDPNTVFQHLWKVDVWYLTDLEEAGRFFLQAAGACGDRDDLKSAILRRALEYMPNSSQAHSALNPLKKAWSEAADRLYDNALAGNHDCLKRAVFGVTAKELIKQGELEEAVLYCLRESMKLDHNRDERLDLLDSLLRSVKSMNSVEALRLLRRLRTGELSTCGWIHWLCARGFQARGLKHEAARHTGMALARMRGRERFWPLFDKARFQLDKDAFNQAAHIAKGLECWRRGRWLRTVALAALKTGVQDLIDIGLTCAEIPCDPGNVPCDSEGQRRYSWELRGRLQFLRKDFFRAKEAFLKALELCDSEEDFQQVYRYLAITSQNSEEGKPFLEYARKSLLNASPDKRVSSLNLVLDAHVLLFNTKAAANTCKLINSESPDWGRLAQLYFGSNQYEEAMSALEGADDWSKFYVLYGFGELARATKYADGLCKERTEVELMSHSERDDFLEGRKTEALGKLSRCRQEFVRSKLARKDLVLHPRNRYYEVRRFRLRPIAFVTGDSPRDVVEQHCSGWVAELLDFHHKEFGEWGGALRVDDLKIFELEHGAFAPRMQSDWNGFVIELEKRLGLRRRRRNEVLLVFHFSPWPNRGFRGVACFNTGFAHIWVSESRFVNKVAVHEFYHAALRLQHSHGELAPNDPWCAMTQGRKALSTAYISPYQKALCLTPRTVQREIQKGVKAESEFRWGDAINHYQRAFKQDPLHKWVARRLIFLLYRENRYEAAVDVNLEHVRYYSNRKAKEQLIDALAFSGRLTEAKNIEKHLPRGDDIASHAMGLAAAWKQAGFFRRALRIAQRHLRESEWSLDLMRQIAEIQWELNYRQASYNTHLQLLERGCQDVWPSLARLACELGDLEKARSHLEYGETQADYSEGRRAWLEMVFAFRSGDWEAGLKHLAAYPSHSESLEHYKTSLSCCLGVVDRDEWERLERESLAFGTVWLARVWLSASKGRLDEGLLKDGCRLNPNDYRWLLTRYLLQKTKQPKEHFHPRILARIKAP